MTQPIPSVPVLVNREGEVSILSDPKLVTPNAHGAGCTLSAASVEVRRVRRPVTPKTRRRPTIAANDATAPRPQQLSKEGWPMLRAERREPGANPGLSRNCDRSNASGAGSQEPRSLFRWSVQGRDARTS